MPNKLVLPAFAEAALRVLMSAKHSANALSSCRIWGIVRCAHIVGTERANVHQQAQGTIGMWDAFLKTTYVITAQNEISQVMQMSFEDL